MTGRLLCRLGWHSRQHVVFVSDDRMIRRCERCRKVLP